MAVRVDLPQIRDSESCELSILPEYIVAQYKFLGGCGLRDVLETNCFQ